MEDFNFPEKRPNEHVLTVIRKHYFTYVRLIFITFFIFTVPIVLVFWVLSAFSHLDENRIIFLNLAIFSCMWFLYGLLFLAMAWIDEEFDIFILTDQRLVDVTQTSFLKRAVAATDLVHIQDTTSYVSGILQTLFNYGDVHVETAAGTASAFEMDHVPDPSSVSRLILNATQNARQQPSGATVD